MNALRSIHRKSEYSCLPLKGGRQSVFLKKGKNYGKNVGWTFSKDVR